VSASGESPAYRTLAPGEVAPYLATRPELRERLGGDASRWQVREVGDGNLNLVYLVEGASGSVCLKQALPYVRAAGPSWPMPPQRAFYEHAYYRAVAPHAGSWVPAIHHYDPDLYCIVMERLSPHIILRRGLIAGRRYPTLGESVGRFIARATFWSSDLGLAFEHKMRTLQLFSGNTALIRISVDLIFQDPYRLSPRNRHTSPELDREVEALRTDGELKLAVARLGERFLSEPQALLHGDLHSGSVMVHEEDVRIIDPEFAFLGPIGFDLGAFFGNLLLAWYAQPGHAARPGERDGHRQWILDTARGFWEHFRAEFLTLWREHSQGDAYPRSVFSGDADREILERERRQRLDGLLRDMLGYAACKMIRRIVGFAHVLDFESIADRRQRARCESAALACARRLLLESWRSIEDVLAMVPRLEAARELGRS